ncbi:MAG TPA: GYF domain-containing protein [Labilithrix sp.]|nr:GYF domain-containing protein [Labilithrix sp.]
MYDAWFYRVGESQVGPVPIVELQRLLGAGQIGPAAAVWRDGMPSWVPAGQVPGLMPAENGLQYIVPTGRTSRSSMAAGYLGIFGLFFFPLGVAAVVLGIVGIRDLKKHPEKNGWGRAITGIVLGGLTTVGLVFLLVLIARGN